MNRPPLPASFPGGQHASPEGWRNPLIAALLVAAAVLILYRPALDFRLLSFDDYYFTRENDLVTGGLDARNIVRAFTTIPEENLFIPVTHLSLMADVALFGMDPRAFHRTSVALHAVNMALLLLLLWRLTGALPESAFAAAFVALHPLRIESVAWMTERKGLLAAFFLLIAISAYLRYSRSGRLRWLWATGAFFLLSLLSKPMAVLFPFLLLLLDFWPLGRIPPAGEKGRRGMVRLALEKAPLLAASLAVSFVTMRLQEKTSLHEGVSLTSRLEHALSSNFIYLWQTIWPSGLAFRFFDTPWAQFSGTFLPVSLATVLLAAAIRRFSPGRPWLVFGFAWFAIFLFPNSGIAPSGAQWISDRFTYLPHVGLAVALSWGGAEFARRRSPAWRTAAMAAAGLVLVLLAASTRSQLYNWRDGVALFGNGLESNGRDPRYRHQYAEELMNLGDYPRALEALREVLPSALDPGYGVGIQFTHLSLLDRMGDRAGAIRAGRDYLLRDPGFWKTRMMLADLLLAERLPAEAAAEYERVLGERMIPPFDRGYAFQGLGLALSDQGRTAEAISAFREGLRFNPASVSLHFNLAVLLSGRREVGQANFHFGEAVRIDPGNPRIRLRFADHLMDSRDAQGAATQFEAAARILPGSAEAAYAQGRVLEAAGMGARASDLYRQAAGLPAALPETAELLRRRMEGRD